MKSYLKIVPLLLFVTILASCSKVQLEDKVLVGLWWMNIHEIDGEDFSMIRNGSRIEFKEDNTYSWTIVMPGQMTQPFSGTWELNAGEKTLTTTGVHGDVYDVLLLNKRHLKLQSQTKKEVFGYSSKYK